MLQYELDALQSWKIVLWVYGFFRFSTWTIKRTFPLTPSRRWMPFQILEKVKEFFRCIMFSKAALHLRCLVSPSHFYNDGVFRLFFSSLNFLTSLVCVPSVSLVLHSLNSSATSLDVHLKWWPKMTSLLVQVAYFYSFIEFFKSATYKSNRCKMFHSKIT